MAPPVLFRTKREDLIQEFEDKGKPFVATTKPYKSTRTLVATVENSIGALPGMVGAFARFEPQTVNLFDYAIAQAVSDGFGGQFAAPDSWTQMQKQGQTNGAVRFVIEGISITWRNVRLQYPNDSITGVTAAAGTASSIRAWAYGNAAAGVTNSPPPTGVDPGALIYVPQAHSPFNLENAVGQVLAKASSCLIQFDQEKIDYIGTSDEFPEGGASSYLRANGQPRHDNRYKIPEGYLWREAGKPDSTMNVQFALREPAVIPLSLVVSPGMSAVVTPLKMAIDFTMRLHGLAVRPPTGN